MENRMIEDFKNFLAGIDIKQIATISIGHAGFYGLSLIAKDIHGGIGGAFTVSMEEDSLPSQYDIAEYDIAKFVELLDWCFKQGWKVQLEVSAWYDHMEKNRKNVFEIEAGSNFSS